MWGREDSQEVGLEAAILERVRNSSLVEWFCADNNDRGSSDVPKLRIGMCVHIPLVGERSIRREAGPEGPVEWMEVRMPA